MAQLDSAFSSCIGLQELFGPLSPDLVALQLSCGSLQGRLRSFHLGALRINLLESNQSLFLSGTRRPKPCTVAVPLNELDAGSAYRAQGIPVQWAGMIGYNRHLTDFDLRIPAGARIATVVIGKEILVEKIKERSNSELILERWGKTNQLELKAPLRNKLIQLIKQQLQQNNEWNPEEPDHIIESILDAFEERETQTTPIGKRESRHEAAIELLHWCSKNPARTATVEQLSDELFQSRTSLFKGAKEHFDRSPLELQRSVRMDRIRQLLQEPERRTAMGLKSVGDCATAMGYNSRSHLARRYFEQYGEQPQTTLANSLKKSE